MKILVIADEESKYLWDFFEKSKVEGIDLIISCGDLDPRYLSFLVTLANVPVLYVHGNHDKKYAQVLGFQLFKKRGFDILVAHSPAYQLNDGRDLPHQGFQVFRTLMEKYHPKYFLHGHVHMSYGRQHKRYDKYMDTHIINAFERCIIDTDDENPQEHIR